MKPGTPSGPAREAFLAKWRDEADAMRRRGALVPGAALCDEVLRDVVAVFETEQDALLTLQEAAARSGYTTDHLGKLIRQGRLANAGRWHSPRIKARDLPRKPAAALEPPGPRGYDPDTDARALSDRQRKGAPYG